MNLSFTLFNRLSCLTGLLVATAIFTDGCSSMNNPASASFASVVIAEESIATIQQATMTVFEENGYQFTGIQDNNLVFKREATRREQVSYAGIVGAQQGEKVDVRVEVAITGKGTHDHRLSCKAYVIRNPGQGVFEEATALFGFQSRPYQKLMDQVAATVAKSQSTP